MTLLFQAGSVIPNTLNTMENMGVFLYLFPFLLALAIFYGVLHWTLEDRIPKSGISLISIILAFFVMLYSGLNQGIVDLLRNLSGAGLIVGSGILFAAILLGLMGFKISNLTSDAAGGKFKWVFILGIIVIAILIFFGAGGSAFGLVPELSNQGELWTIVFFIIVIAIVMWWLGEDGKSGGAPPAGGKPE
ncbi:MAG: hypothetical protein JRI49_04905 [Deltaproteobacteria bacterium]|nr:hypothetical protein [Deltaproteobacteria bacterium]